MGMKFTNNASTTLASGISAVATSLTVQTGAGALFPVLGAGDYFYCTLSNTVGNVEIIKVTARTGDVFNTIVRAQDNTTALVWNAGDRVELRLVSASLNDFPKLDENNTFSGNNTVNLTTSSTAITQSTGDSSTKISTTAFAQNTTISAGFSSITASVATNALTCTLVAPSLIQFRNTTLTSGAPLVSSIISNITLTIPSGATLGTANGVSARLILLVAYNGGTPVLCITNLSGGLNLDETSLISPTTISGTSNSSNVIYSASVVSANSPFRVVGFLDITEASAGTWATSPTTVQGSGGQAVASMSSFGYGQKWQDLTASRTNGVIYTNTTGKMIKVSCRFEIAAGSAFVLIIDPSGTPLNVDSYYNNTASGPIGVTFQCEVPPGMSYEALVTAGTATKTSWLELR